ncbi:MAG TPA: PQQ-binding-like beta-propeller repeat protein, partial [Terriglobales bacterium]|nr:PQQ-binding-like beta-propeller repeat protein [Terriglobales bacterium]
MRSSFLPVLAASSILAIVSCSGGGNHHPPVSDASNPLATRGAVVTRNYDNARSGVNPFETKLTPDKINAAGFGKLFSYPVDGSIYGQPLYVPGVAISGKGTHNVLFVATENDTVYAFDADQNPGAPLWTQSLVEAAEGETPVPCAEVAGCAVAATIGVTATPVISIGRNAIYVEARSKQAGAYFHKLHALDLATGKEMLGGPVTISAAVPGTAADRDAQGMVHFNTQRENARSALLLENNVVYICFASLSDVGPYHGWVLGYNADTLKQVAAFNNTPNGAEGGIFANNGAVADAGGNIFVVSGNGTPPPSKGNYGQTFVKLSGASLQPVDFFTPFNAATMNLTNIDVGSGGFLLLPDQTGTSHPHLLVGAGKEGRIYLVDRDNMGKFN